LALTDNSLEEVVDTVVKMFYQLTWTAILCHGRLFFVVLLASLLDNAL